MPKTPFWTIVISVLMVVLYFQHLPGIPPIWPGILTFHFSHSGPEHLMQNLLTLLIFGYMVESKDGWKVLPVLFIPSVAGGLATIPFGGGRGMSAGIFGLMGYIMSKYPGVEIFGIPAGALTFSYALYNLFFQSAGISALAHAVGFLAGMGFARKKDGFTYFVAGINILAAILWVVRFG